MGGVSTGMEKFDREYFNKLRKVKNGKIENLSGAINPEVRKYLKKYFDENLEDIMNKELYSKELVLKIDSPMIYELYSKMSEIDVKKSVEKALLKEKTNVLTIDFIDYETDFEMHKKEFIIKFKIRISEF